MAIASDSHPANASTSRDSAPRKRSLFSRILGVLIASMIFSILAEWVGMFFFWPEQGATHSARMLSNELNYLNSDFQSALFGSTVPLLIEGVASSVYYWVFEWTRIEDGLGWLFGTIGLDEYFFALINTTQLFMVRVGILTFSLPAFVMFAFVGVASGLGLRDIRRWSAGREFGGVYHRAKWIAPKAIVLAWIVYLSMPFSIHPNAVILPCAALFGFNMLVISASFKKYL